ncbi:MAG: bifunctional metallophosphatase/5'-nucleotidase [Syntrophobacteraceae bacterium]
MQRIAGVLLPFLIFLLLPHFISAGETASIHITILHLNDTHGRILPYIEKSIDESMPLGGSAYLAKMIENARSENPGGTLLLAAGDMFQGTPLSYVFLGQPVVRIMNYLKFDALSLGNHEFDWGRDALNTLITTASFPFLSANIKDSSGQYPSGIKPYAILTRKGLKIAVIGITTTDTPCTTKPSNVSGLSFSDPEAVLPQIIATVRNQKVNLVILLSHCGLDADRELAAKLSGIDVIIGGHSHTVVTDPVVEHGTIIVQAGYNGLYLGALDLQVEASTNKITAYTKHNELRPVSASPDAPFDEKVARLVEQYDNQIKGEFSKVIGESSVDLVRHPYEESNIGNLIADLMRQATGADIALQNGGGIRADLTKGKITLDGIFSVLPFDNALITMDLTGSQMLKVLEENIDMEHRILQVSGLTVEYDIKKPLGSRVLKVLAGGEPLNLLKIYRVTVNDFLAAGGDGIATLKEGKNLQYGDNLRDAFTDYLRMNSPVSPRIEGRISFIK